MEILSDKEIKIMKEIRDAVPRPDEYTVLQKIITEKEIENYIGDNGYNKIKGFIVKMVDVQHLSTYNYLLEGLRLDYIDRPYSAGGDTFGYIKFQTYEADKIEIPYGIRFGGNNTYQFPCTLNGFTASENEIIPEWVVLDEDGLAIKRGAELHKVVGRDDRIIAVYRSGHFRRTVDYRGGKELKRGWFGVYKGNEYELTSDLDGKCFINTKDKNIVDDTFEYNHNSCMYIKKLFYSELESAYDLKVYALVDGVKIGVLKETDDEYLVSTFGNDKDIIEKYYLKEIDRGIFDGWVSKKFVQLLEERRELQYDPEKKKLVFKE